MRELKGRVVLASHNAGKLREFQAAMRSSPVELVSAGELSLPEPEETGDTFVANAILKANAAATASSLPALADDSGLSVKMLDGAPGIYSARWAGPGKDFGVAMERIRSELAETNRDDMSASFICVLAVAWPDGEVVTAEGRIDGKLTFPPRGTGGFGYDPIFIPEGETKTFGEMVPEQKAAYSHRMRALEALWPKVFV